MCGVPERVVRPVFLGEGFAKAAERTEQRAEKAKMVVALEPLQVGIGVPSCACGRAGRGGACSKSDGYGV